MSNAIKTILQIAVPSPLRHTFDYLLPENCNIKNVKPGMRVLVSFGKRELIGVILDIVTNSKLDITKLKPIITVLDDKPLLSKNMLSLINWTSNYYHHPVGDVVNNVLPKQLRQKNS